MTKKIPAQAQTKIAPRAMQAQAMQVLAHHVSVVSIMQVL
jgi:hypothetical protein